MHPTLQRFDQAKKRRDAWQSTLEEAYQYALPSHTVRDGQAYGARVDRQIYDDTAVTALAQKKAKLHGQLFPAFEEWMDFDFRENFDEDARALLADWLSLARQQFHKALENSNFHIEIDSALADSCISTGAIMIHEGTDRQPLRFEAIPIAEFIPEEGLSGMIETVFRSWAVPFRDIEKRWPDCLLSEEVCQSFAKTPEKPIRVIEAFLSEEAGGCHYQVFLDASKGQGGDYSLCLERFYRSHPLIAFRMDKAPGEWMGRGPVLSVLGDIKTANKVVELILKNASIAVTGIWQADDDGVLNPANITLKPGTIIPKATGSSGLTPLQTPGRFDVSEIVLERLQQNIQRGILGPQLMMETGKVRTALEVDIRQSQQESIEVPISLRLLSELVMPLAERILAILMSPRFAGSSYYIPPLEIGDQLVRPVPKSPVLRLKDQVQAREKLQIFSFVQQVMPDLAPMLINREVLLKDLLKKSGFTEEFFTPILTDLAENFEAALHENGEQEGAG